MPDQGNHHITASLVSEPRVCVRQESSIVPSETPDASMSTPLNTSLLPHLVDERGQEARQRIYAIIPCPTGARDGFREITYRQLSGAVNKMSWWLDEVLTPGRRFETFAYIGESDLRYPILALAAQKTQRRMLVLSLTNSVEGTMQLLDETNCSTIISTKGTELQLRSVMEQRGAPDKKIILDLEHWLDGQSVDHYPYDRTYEDAIKDPWMIGQTSGTTGVPKAVDIGVINEVVRAYQKVLSDKNPPQDRSVLSLIQGCRYFQALPLSWMPILQSSLDFAIYWNAIIVRGPDSLTPLSVDDIDVMHRFVDFDGGFYTPGQLREVAKKPTVLGNMKNKGLKYINYGGAPLDKSTGDIYASFTRMQPFLGSVELGIFPIMLNDPIDWEYFRFRKDAGIVMEPHKSAPDLCELVLRREADVCGFQTIFANKPDLNVWHTHDLYRRHTSKPDLWLHEGRTDDLIKNENLTKSHATHVEAIVMRHPQVTVALMGGEGSEYHFLLLEGDWSDSQRSGSVNDDVWSTVEQANQILSEEVRIKRGNVILTKADKPFQKLIKGTVNRRATLAEYKDEIAAVLS